MAKEAKTTNVTAKLNYDGVELTISKFVYDYELEAGVKDLVTQVKLLAKGSDLSVTMD